MAQSSVGPAKSLFIKVKPSSKPIEQALRLRLFQKGSEEVIVRTELNRFLKEHRRVKKWDVGSSIKKLRQRKRLYPALKLQESMAKRGMTLTVSDQAIHLDLISKVRGISAAESYFIELPDTAKNHLTYGALLNCYCKEKITEKAEALMEKMKELKFASTAMAYNSLMTLYKKVGHPEKVPAIIQEMKSDNVSPDSYTYSVWMRALAAVNDITGVERVHEEMKRDGRVQGDWTTYSNLASIYVEAGFVAKAETALKELEKRNGYQDLSAFQFLITLYGRTGNLPEVYRVWRSLKLAFPKPANMSYLNMIQVLIKLKDLSGAEKCLSEYESKFSTYDIRVANAVIGAYTDRGMIEKAESVRNRARRRGAEANSKTWEIFMNSYLREKQFKLAVESLEKAILAAKENDRAWEPSPEVVSKLMMHFEEAGDVEASEGFIEILKKGGSVGPEVFEPLIRTYVAAGKTFPAMRRRLKMESVEVNPSVEKLLELVSVE